jgi:hypothetical protein
VNKVRKFSFFHILKFILIVSNFNFSKKKYLNLVLFHVISKISWEYLHLLHKILTSFSKIKV